MGLGEFFRGIFGGSKPEGDRCVACESADLDVFAPSAYRCQICGYEGGDGYAAYLADKERARCRAESTDALLARAVKRLENARLALVAALGISDSGVGWAISLTLVAADVPLGVVGEEAERLRAQRESGLIETRAELLALRPILDVLGEKGMDVGPHLARLDAIAAKDPCPPELLTAFIEPAGAELSGARASV